MDTTRRRSLRNMHRKLPRWKYICGYIRASNNVIRRHEEPKMDPTFPLVLIANLVACLLILLSLSKNMFQAWNVGACSFAFWTALSSLEVVVNSIIWSDNAENKAPIWCDISEYIQASLPRERLALTILNSNTPCNCLWCSHPRRVLCNHSEVITHDSPEQRHVK